MPGRPSPLTDETVVHAFRLYLVAVQYSIPNGPFAAIADPRVLECCAVTGLPQRVVRTLFKEFGIQSKRIYDISYLEKSVGSLEEFDYDPAVRDMAGKIATRRSKIRSTHFQVSLRALTIRAEKKEAARAAAWRERRPGETLEEYRLRLDVGDPIVIAQQRAAVARAHKRIRAMEESCPKT